MADQALRTRPSVVMKRHSDRTVDAAYRFSAVLAHERSCIASSVKEKDSLLLLRKSNGHRLPERYGKNIASAKLDLLFHIDRNDLRQSRLCPCA